MPLLKHKLKKYQAEDIKKLLEAEKACNFNVPGSGKTPTTLGVFQVLANNGYRHFVVVAEPSLLLQWSDEVHKFTDMTVYACRKLTPTKRHQLFTEWSQSTEPAVLIIGYPTILSDYPFLFDLFSKMRIKKTGAIAFDEATILTNKNKTSLKAKYLAEKFRFVYALTATPITTSPVQFYSIFRAIGVRPCTQQDFVSQCCKVEETKLWQGYGMPPRIIKRVVGITNPERVKELFEKHYIRRNRKDIAADFEEKEKNIFYYTFQMTSVQKGLYAEWKKEGATIRRNGEEIKFENNGLTRYLYLKQVLDNPWLVDDRLDCAASPKLQGFLRLVEGELAEENKIFCFAQFKRFGQLVADALNDAYGKGSAVVLNGDLSKEEIAENTAAFQKGNARFLIATTIAERGLNLQNAHTTVFFDLPPTVSSIIQLQGRTDRVGQESPFLNYYFLLMDDSIEYKIFQTLRSRAETFDALMEDETIANLNLESDEFIKGLL